MVFPESGDFNRVETKVVFVEKKKRERRKERKKGSFLLVINVTFRIPYILLISSDNSTIERCTNATLPPLFKLQMFFFFPRGENRSAEKEKNCQASSLKTHNSIQPAEGEGASKFGKHLGGRRDRADHARKTKVDWKRKWSGGRMIAEEKIRSATNFTSYFQHIFSG